MFFSQNTFALMPQNKFFFQSKLYKMIILLGNSRRHFKRIASSTQDKELKILALQFVQNNIIFIHQLSGFLPENSFFISQTSSDERAISIGKSKEKLRKEEAFERCKKEKKSLEQGYRELLNLSRLDENLKKVFQNQLNKTKALFLKMEINELVKTDSPYSDKCLLFFYKFVQ